MKKSSIKKVRFFSSFLIVVVICLISSVYFFSPDLVTYVSGKKDDPVYYFGNKKSNMIALMFNCYEGKENIIKISDTLKERNLHATFFFGGCFADDNEELLVYLVDSGHEIANHGYFHKSHSKLNFESNVKEIERTEDIILAFCGVKTNLFAPPSGDFSENTLQACQKLDYKLIMWSKDTIDWRDKDEKIVYNRATKNISGGDFILMHPKATTAKILPEILNYYEKNGLIVSTVSQCME